MNSEAPVISASVVNSIVDARPAPGESNVGAFPTVDPTTSDLGKIRLGGAFRLPSRSKTV